MREITLEQAMQIAVDHHLAGRFPQAESLYRQVLSVKPDHVDALHNLGAIALQLEHFEPAVALLGRAAQLSPQHFDAHTNLTLALVRTGKFERAVEIGRRAIALRPDDAGALNNLGMALRKTSQLDNAIDCFTKALELDCNFIQACNNLGLALQAVGQMEQAIAMYQRAIALDPTLVTVHDNIVLAEQYRPSSNSQSLRDTGKQWNLQHAEPLAHLIQRHTNSAVPDRRLRVGYISPDLWNHSVARFILPLLKAHDRCAFEIICYADVAKPDDLTAELQSHADIWRNIYGQPDQQVADLIRKDSIDILVDLAMHTSSNRLLVFAQKPAPIQMSYLAYAGGPALRAIDFHLSDRYLEPEGVFDNAALQPPAYLEATYWCYQQTFNTPSVNILPAISAGHVTFGCLNNFCKISGDVLETWAALMNRVPASRLLLHAPPGKHCDRLRNFMLSRGIEPTRIEMLGWLFAEQYFDVYQRMDIALDPFPFAGGTTTCDALWMGVPVVTLAGTTPVGRSGVSILSNAAMPELIADSKENYVHIANELAKNLPRLNDLRLNMQRKVEASSLMDVPAYSRSIEAAYRRIWVDWCNG